jgi:peptidyl-prolyl cis-trans isomerase D
VLRVAFEMEEEEPQVAELGDGTFVVFDVSDITTSATAPLADIRDDVTAAWRRDEGSKQAKAAADRILARVARGGTLAQAVAAESKPLPAAQTLDLNREQLAQQGRVQTELALFFSMAEGTTKKLEGPNDAGWFVVRLDGIEAPEVAADDPIVLATLRQLSGTTSNEYLEQFVMAAQREVGVERNQAAIDAVAAQLTGQNNQ